MTWSVPIATAGTTRASAASRSCSRAAASSSRSRALNGTISAFHSDNGGASWSRAVKVAGIRFHGVAGDLRTSPLPTAEIAGDGTIYVAWEDCRFRKKCASNDIVFSKSSDGVDLDRSGPRADRPRDEQRRPLHPRPGRRPDDLRRGHAPGADVLLLSQTPTARGACRLDVGYISSPDGGAHWGDATQLAGPMALAEIAQTSQGPMVGDYISTSFSGGKATTVFPVGRDPTDGRVRRGHVRAPPPGGRERGAGDARGEHHRRGPARSAPARRTTL